MNSKYGPIKSFCLLAGILCFAPLRTAHALAVTNVSLSDTNIPYETGGLPNGTTISFTIDSPGLLQIAVNCGIQNFGDAGTNVANLSQTYAASSTYTIFWNGLWLIGGDQGRLATKCDFSLTLSTNGTTSAATVPPTLVTLNSVDIHNLSVVSGVDSNGTATSPYRITYALAKSANVTMTIANTSSTTVRTLLSNASQVSESISSHTITWDGLADGGQPVPIGAYTLTINAVDSAIPNSHAIPRSAVVVVQSLAGAAADPQKLFEENAYVFPNPVRNGLGTFQIEAVRDGSNLSLRIYTLTGDLVREQNYSGVGGGTYVMFPWDVTNQAGRKVGRGLYYYVVREEDPVGTLQTVKKMAVLP